jgi:hypothetical protein
LVAAGGDRPAGKKRTTSHSSSWTSGIKEEVVDSVPFRPEGEGPRLSSSEARELGLGWWRSLAAAAAKVDRDDRNRAALLALGASAAA